MGNHAGANNVIGLAKPSSDNGWLSENAIHQLVDRFYAKVRIDPEFGPIFERAIPATGDRISRPCTTSGRRSCSPAGAIRAILSQSISQVEGIEPQLFERWLALFDETCSELFDADIAEAFRR